MVQIRPPFSLNRRMSSADASLQKVARIRMSDEWSDYTLYDRLARTVKSDSPFAEVLKTLSA